MAALGKREAERMRQFSGQVGRPLIAAATIRLLATPARAQAPATPPATAATAPQTPAAPVATTPEEPIEALKSLFDPAENTVVLAGRATSVSGDEARYQRYQDMGSGFLMSGARLKRQTADYMFTAGADNIAWRDQRFFADYVKTGVF